MLTVVGSVAYLHDNANLSLPTIFYGIPILLGGLALKSAELPPAERLTPPAQLRELRDQPSSEPLKRLLNDVTRWRYGQKAHLESSLEALKLWDEADPPRLEQVEELADPLGYGLRLIFVPAGVPAARWQEREERLGRFFGPGLQAEVASPGDGRISLTLRPRPAEP